MAKISPQVLPPLDDRQRYTTAEAEAYLRISHARLYQLIGSGKINVIRDGRRVFIPGSEIIRSSRV